MKNYSMNFWDYLKFFPMFETFFGNKEFYFSLDETDKFKNLNSHEINRLNIYDHNMKSYKIYQFDKLIYEIVDLTIQILSKIVYFPFNFTYFDYSADNKLNDISIIIFPEQIIPLILDFEFYGLVHQLYLGCKYSLIISSNF